MPALAELVAPTYACDLRGRIRVEPKEKSKERLRRSPDHADVLALAVGHCYQEGSCASRGSEGIGVGGRGSSRARNASSRRIRPIE